jgi:hypothetical protein
MDILKID